MRCQYVTDDEIQQYLEDQKVLDSETIQHIQNCETCQQILKHYKNLIAELTVEPVCSLNQNFGDEVLAQLPKKRKGFLRNLNQEILLGVVGTILSLSALIYYIKPKPIIEMFQRITFPNMNLVSLLAPLKTIFAVRLANSHLLLFSLIAFVGIMILDKAFLLPRFTRFYKPYLKTY